MSLDDTKKRVDIFASLVTTVGLVVGGSFALVQYSEKNHSDRIKESLGYIDKFAQREVRKHREDLGTAFVAHQQEFETAAKQGGESYTRWVVTFIESNNLAPNVFAVGEIYEQLAICIEAELCDREMGLRFFLEDAQGFFRGLYPYIQKRRTDVNDPRLFENLERLSKETRIVRSSGRRHR